MKIPNDLIKYLAYYLSRSVLWDFDADRNLSICYNEVAEEAKAGNELAKQAMDARQEVLRILEENNNTRPGQPKRVLNDF